MSLKCRCIAIVKVLCLPSRGVLIEADKPMYWNPHVLNHGRHKL